MNNSYDNILRLDSEYSLNVRAVLEPENVSFEQNECLSFVGSASAKPKIFHQEIT